MQHLPVKNLLLSSAWRKKRYSGASLNDVNWFQKTHCYGKTSLSETPFPIGMQTYSSMHSNGGGEIHQKLTKSQDKAKLN